MNFRLSNKFYFSVILYHCYLNNILFFYLIHLRVEYLSVFLPSIKLFFYQQHFQLESNSFIHFHE